MTNVEAIKQQAGALSQEERVAHFLLTTLDDEEADMAPSAVAEAWEREIARRSPMTNDQ